MKAIINDEWENNELNCASNHVAWRGIDEYIYAIYAPDIFSVMDFSSHQNFARSPNFLVKEKASWSINSPRDLTPLLVGIFLQSLD